MNARRVSFVPSKRGRAVEVPVSRRPQAMASVPVLIRAACFTRRGKSRTYLIATYAPCELPQMRISFRFSASTKPATWFTSVWNEYSIFGLSV
jgi:hypothetical protein